MGGGASAIPEENFSVATIEAAKTLETSPKMVVAIGKSTEKFTKRRRMSMVADVDTSSFAIQRYISKANPDTKGADFSVLEVLESADNPGLLDAEFSAAVANASSKVAVSIKSKSAYSPVDAAMPAASMKGSMKGSNRSARYQSTKSLAFRRFKDNDRYRKVRFIDFELLKERNEFPLYSAEGWRVPGELRPRHLTVSANEIDFENSFVVFISHCWEHSKVPKPDTPQHDHYKLCVEAIQYMKENWAPGMEKCYVFVDYSCLSIQEDPDKPPNLDKEMILLDLIIGCCDCMLTPLFDKNDKWQPPESIINDFFAELNAEPWKGQQDSYLNRAWCRMEMLYCSNIPVMSDISAENARREKLQGRLLNFISRNQRPHVIYSNYQKKAQQPPVSFSPISNEDLLANYHPSSGKMSNPSDKPILTRLFNEAQAFIKAERSSGYEGEVNAVGEMHGQGTYRYSNGDVYTGQWKNGLHHGEGVMKLANGDEITGEYNLGIEFGLCTYNYANGDVYYGMLCCAQKVGRGILEYKNGDVFEGFFKNNVKDGEGRFTYADGSSFDGSYRNDLRNGQGVLRNADGTVTYKGLWRNDQKKQRRNSM